MIMLSLWCFGCRVSDVKPQENDTFNRRILHDARAVRRYRHGLVSVINFIASRPDLFMNEKHKRLLRREQKEEIWNLLDSTQREKFEEMIKEKPFHKEMKDCGKK